MKVKIEIEIDLTDAPGYNIDTVDDIRGSLQNLGSWLNQLHLSNLMLIMDTYKIEDPIMREATGKIYEQDIAMSEQLFNNYRVEGKTEDGHDFTFSHREPGYIERLFVDGRIVE